MNQIKTETSRKPAQASAGKLMAALGEAAERFEQWRRRARGRHQLMSLGDDVLKDIGVGRSEAYSEYSKPFWRN